MSGDGIKARRDVFALLDRAPGNGDLGRRLDGGRILDEVRQPIYTHSIGRAAHYGDHLEPLVRALRAHGADLADAKITSR